MINKTSVRRPIVGGRRALAEIARGCGMYRSTAAVVLMIVLAIGAGCRSMTGESAGRNIDDATITTEVKAKLAAEKASNLTRVSVATANGSVSLTGIVPTAAARMRAEEIARGVKGVQAVANNLQVEKP